MVNKGYKKFKMYELLEQERRLRWARINSRFAKNDSPAGCKLMATGCMERFNGPRDEERLDRIKSNQLETRTNREEWLERDRLASIEPDMSLDAMLAILNPKEKMPWECDG